MEVAIILSNFFEKLYSIIYTLYGVHISINFGFRLNRLAFNATKAHFHISEVNQR